MARINFTRAETARLLRLPDADAVEALIRAKLLPIAAFTPTGRPLFDAEDVRRAALRVAATDDAT